MLITGPIFQYQRRQQFYTSFRYNSKDLLNHVVSLMLLCVKLFMKRRDNNLLFSK